MRELLGGAIALLLLYLFRSLSMRLRFRRGIAAEARAIRLAERAGYRVVGIQVPGTVAIVVDGRTRVLHVRADMLLERRFRRFIAEVKTGRVAPDPTSRATRRQLLEYTHAFNADGLLLFDMEKERIHQIRFGTFPLTGRWKRVCQRVASAVILFGAGALFEWSFRLLATVAPRP